MSKTMRMTALAYNVINNNITKNKMLRDENSLVDKILEELEIIKLDEEKIMIRLLKIYKNLVK